MRRSNCLEAPLQLYGLAPGYKKGRFRRLPQWMEGKVSETVTELGRRATGGRLRFRTDSTQIRVRVSLLTLAPDQNFPILGSAGCDILVGAKEKSAYRGIASPLSFTGEKTAECAFEKSAQMENVTVYLPRNEQVADIDIFIEDNARIEAPTPYRWPAPIAFYGSSITEGCSACRPSNAYAALVSRWLDTDFLNLGFSGAAKGEPAMAEYIAGLNLSALVLDYDFNAPNPEHLAATHEPFFQIIRRTQPHLPILILSAPVPEYDPPQMARRRAIIRATYEAALSRGDAHVDFLDGHAFFGENDRSLCTIDTLHPNDIGMLRMAEAVYPALRRLLVD